MYVNGKLQQLTFEFLVASLMPGLFFIKYSTFLLAFEKSLKPGKTREGRHLWPSEGAEGAILSYIPRAVLRVLIALPVVAILLQWPCQKPWLTCLRG